MKKFLFTFAVLASATAFFASPAFAYPPHDHATVHSAKLVVHNGPTRTIVHNANIHGSNHGIVNSGRFANYHVTHGVRFDHGYLYRGRNHSHWGLIRFDARYGCQCYWDPYACSWFYFCVPDNCYYPVSYCPYRIYNWPANGLPGYPVGPVGPVGPGPVGPGPVGPGPVGPGPIGPGPIGPGSIGPVPIDPMTSNVPPLPDPMVPQAR